MAGFLSLLGPALTAGTDAANGALAGQAQARATQQSQMMAAIAQMRQQHEDAMKDAATQADVDLKKVQTAAGGFRPNPAPANSQPHYEYDNVRGAMVLVPGSGGTSGAPVPPPVANAPVPPPVASTPVPPPSTPLGGNASGPESPTTPAAPPPAPPAAPPDTVPKPPVPPVASPSTPPPSGAPAPVVLPQGLPPRPQALTPRQFTENGQPVEGFSDPLGNFYHADHTKATGRIGPYNKPSEALVKVQGPPDVNGNPTTIYVPQSQAAGMAAPGASGAAGQTRLPERSQQFGLALHNAVDALPLHQGMAQNPPGLVSGIAGSMMTTGGTQGQVGGDVLNHTNADYGNYITGMNGLLLAVAHSVGGARINKEQVNMFGSNMEVAAGDTPAKVQQKLGNIVDFLNAARATLPPNVVAQQEAQIGPEGLAYLKSVGYGGVPGPAGKALVGQLQAMGGVAPDDPANTVKPKGGAGGNAPQQKTITQADVKLLPAAMQTPAYLKQYGYTVIP